MKATTTDLRELPPLDQRAASELGRAEYRRWWPSSSSSMPKTGARLLDTQVAF